MRDRCERCQVPFPPHTHGNRDKLRAYTTAYQRDRRARSRQGRREEEQRMAHDENETCEEQEARLWAAAAAYLNGKIGTGVPRRACDENGYRASEAIMAYARFRVWDDVVRWCKRRETSCNTYQSR